MTHQQTIEMLLRDLEIGVRLLAEGTAKKSSVEAALAKVVAAMAAARADGYINRAFQDRLDAAALKLKELS